MVRKNKDLIQKLNFYIDKKMSGSCTNDSFDQIDQKVQERDNKLYVHEKCATTEDVKIHVSLSRLHKKLKGEIIVDSGATRSMTGIKENLVNLRRLESPLTIRFGNGSTLKSYFEGTLVMGNVAVPALFVERLKVQLLSIRELNALGWSVVFSQKESMMYHPTHRDPVILKSAPSGLYTLNTPDETVDAMAATIQDHDLLHRMYGHSQKITGNPKDAPFCKVCAKGKLVSSKYSARSRNPHDNVKSKEEFMIDTRGPFKISARGNQYCTNIMDRRSRYLHCITTPRKNREVSMKAIAYLKPFRDQIHSIRADGGEMTTVEFKSFCLNNGITLEISPPGESNINASVERSHRTVGDQIRCMLIDANLSEIFWDYAASYSAYIQNITPSASGHTPYMLFHGRDDRRKPFVFGSECYTLNSNAGKLDQKGDLSIFLGYSTFGIFCYNFRLDKVIESRSFRINNGERIDQSLLELRGLCNTDISNDDTELLTDDSSHEDISQLTEPTHHSDPSYEDLSEMEPDDNPTSSMDELPDTVPTPQSEPFHESITLRRSPRTTWNLTRAKMIQSALIAHDITDLNHVLIHNSDVLEDIQDLLDGSSPSLYQPDNVIDTALEPRSYEDAMNSNQSGKWKLAIEEEYQSLLANKTWDLVDEHQATKPPIRGKWVFKVKRSSTGVITRYKARFVAKGFTQKYGKDFFDIYSPVGSKTSLRCLLAYAAAHNLKLASLDCKTAFLNADIDCEVYLHLPQGFNVPGKLARLRKSIYGLKQASRLWNQMLHGILEGIGFQRSRADPCIYLSESIVLFVYVDDILCMYEKDVQFNQFFAEIQNKIQVSITDSTSLLGIQIQRTEAGIFINQPSYVQNLLEKYGHSDCYACVLPMDPNGKFLKRTEEDEPFHDLKLYASAVGTLMYLGNCTRPDILLAVSVLASFVNDPSVVHWEGISRIFRYLRGTMEYGIFYKRGKEGIEKFKMWSDADHATCLDTRRSRSGVMGTYNGASITAFSRKQGGVTLSTLESENYSFSESVREGIFVSRLLYEFDVRRRYDGEKLEPFENQMDSNCLVELGDGDSTKLKHVDVREMFGQEMVQKQVVIKKFVSTQNNISDQLTKPLTREPFEKLRAMSGVVPEAVALRVKEKREQAELEEESEAFDKIVILYAAASYIRIQEGTLKSEDDC
jgi:transposase InsO family protein